MAPKKAVATVATKKVAAASTGKSRPPGNPSKLSRPPGNPSKLSRPPGNPSKLSRPPGNPSTLSMVVEALRKDPVRNGTSVPAIRSRILAAHPGVDPVRLRFLLRSALIKGLEKGVLTRPANSSAKGATGRFKLAKPVKKPKGGRNSELSENKDPNVPTKTVKKPKATEGNETGKTKVTGKKTKGAEKPKPAPNAKKVAAKEGKAVTSKKPTLKTPTEGARAKKAKASNAVPDKAAKTEEGTGPKRKKGK